jgi:protoporphyrinogen oxidase
VDEAGFVWDLGGHVIHSHFSEFDQVIAAAGTEMVYPKRAGYVWEPTGLVGTPIQHQLDSLPDDLHPADPAPNLGAYYVNNFGSALNERFFRPFNERMWAHPLELVDHAWTSLRSGSSEANVPAPAARGTLPSRQQSFFPYPKHGTGALWRDVATLFDPSRCLATSLLALDAGRRIAYLPGGEQVRYQRMVSTIPISDLIRLTGLPGLQRYGGAFLCSQVIAVGVGCVGEPPEQFEDLSWLYSASPKTLWHRATILSNYSPAVAGPGRWSVLFETGVSAYRPLPIDEVKRSCVEWLEEFGHVRAERLQSRWARHLAMGYPVPNLGRDPILREIDNTLRTYGIRSRGRFGGWRYESSNQDFSFMQGVQAVRASCAELSGAAEVEEDVYWHPERY